MTTPLVSAELYTHWHRILGKFNPGAAGALSFFNLPTKSSVSIEGAHLNRLSQPSKLVARFPWLWLVRSQILAVLLSNRSEVGLAAVARGGYSRIVRNSVLVVLGDFEACGVVETPGKLNYDAFVFEGEGLFFPIYEAQLTSAQYPEIKTEAAVALINRKEVVAISALPREKGES